MMKALLVPLFSFLILFGTTFAAQAAEADAIGAVNQISTHLESSQTVPTQSLTPSLAKRISSASGEVDPTFASSFPRKLNPLASHSATIGKSHLLLVGTEAKQIPAMEKQDGVVLLVFEFKETPEGLKLDDYRLRFADEFPGSADKVRSGDSTGLRHREMVLDTSNSFKPDQNIKTEAIVLNSGTTFTPQGVKLLPHAVQFTVPGVLVTVPAEQLSTSSQKHLFGEDFVAEAPGEEEVQANAALERLREKYEQQKIDQELWKKVAARYREAASGGLKGFGQLAPAKWAPAIELAKGETHPLNIATLLPGINRHSIPRATAMHPSGVILIGGGEGLRAPGAPVFNLSATPTGAILRYEPSTGTFLSTTILNIRVEDLTVDDEGYIYVAGVTTMKLDPQALSIIWEQPVGGHKLELAADGSIFLFNKGESRAYQLTPEGERIRDFTLKAPGGPAKHPTDMVIDEENRLVIASGHYNQRPGGVPVWIPWIAAYSFEGERKWWMYGFAGRNVKAVGDMADARIHAMQIGEDGKLYFVGEAEGGNHVFRHSSKEAGSKLPGGATWIQRPLGDKLIPKRAFKITVVMKAEPATGTVEKGAQIYTEVPDHVEGKEDQLITGNVDGNDIAVTDDGTITIVGESSGRVLWKGPAFNRVTPPVNWQDHYGHKQPTYEPFMTILNSEFTPLFNSGFGLGETGEYIGILTRVAAGGPHDIVSAVGRVGHFYHLTDTVNDKGKREKSDEPVPESENNYVYHNALLTSFNDPEIYHQYMPYFVVYGPQPNTSARVALRVHLQSLPLKELQPLAQKLLKAPELEPVLKANEPAAGDEDLQLEYRLLTEALSGLGAQLKARAEIKGDKKALAEVQTIWGPLLNNAKVTPDTAQN